MKGFTGAVLVIAATAILRTYGEHDAPVYVGVACLGMTAWGILYLAMGMSRRD